MSLNPEQIKNIVEAALMAAGKPLSLDTLLSLFLDESQPSRDEMRAAIEELQAECAGRGVELVEVGSGFRYQAKQDFAHWIARLWEEKPPRYSRALLETLALIAYRQPITRGEIEDVRGVSVSTNIIKTLLEREWVKVVGHRDVPGKPAMYATTKQFLDYFSLKSLNDMPTLAEIRDIDTINAELDFADPDSAAATTDQAEKAAEPQQANTAPDHQAEAETVTDETDSVAEDGEEEARSVQAISGHEPAHDMEEVHPVQDNPYQEAHRREALADDGEALNQDPRHTGIAWKDPV